MSIWDDAILYTVSGGNQLLRFGWSGVYYRCVSRNVTNPPVKKIPKPQVDTQTVSAVVIQQDDM